MEGRQRLVDIPVICINLKKREDRQKHFKEQAARAKLSNFSFFSAVDGADASELSKAQDLAGLLFEEKELSDAEKGRFLSHVLIWKQLINKGAPYTIVLEDDVTFVQNFSELLTTIEVHLPRSIIFFGYIDIASASLAAINQIELKPLGGVPPPHGYCISLEAADFLLRELQKRKVFLPVESFIYSKRYVLNILQTSRSIAIQNYGLRSDIQKPAILNFLYNIFKQYGFPY